MVSLDHMEASWYIIVVLNQQILPTGDHSQFITRNQGGTSLDEVGHSHPTFSMEKTFILQSDFSLSTLTDVAEMLVLVEGFILRPKAPFPPVSREPVNKNTA